MLKFYSNSLTKFLALDKEDIRESAIPVYVVAKDKATSFIENLPAEQSSWAKANHFEGKDNQLLNVADASGELTAVFIGTGDSTPGLATLAKSAKRLPPATYYLADQSIQGDSLKLFSIGWAIAQYEFDQYKAQKNSHHAVLLVNDKELLNTVHTIVDGISLVRDLVNTPTCDMGPSHLSTVMKDLSDKFKGDFSAIVGDELLEKNFNTIHTVGRAAANAPRLLDMRWGKEDAPKLTLVGKGVCFDSGGLDLKPAAGMRIMKKDMGGAAHALGLAQMIMSSGLNVRLRVLIPAVENNISADAFRPGDIIHTYKGTTVEIGNTDAEGRLVLCDALALASEENPDLLLDFATLTGAARIAMGADIVPFFTDGNEIACDLQQKSGQEDDPMWQLPLFAEYETQLKSNFADLNNMGASAFGGSITAALFLKHFVSNPENWVHFDLYAWNLKEKATCPEGGEAMAIRAIFAYLQEKYAEH